MVSLDKAIIGSYEREGKKFQVYLDPDNAYAYIDGRRADLRNILVVDEVFTDLKKGERAKATDLQKVFGTTDIMAILKFIFEKGEIPLTTEQRRKKVEEKRKQVIATLMQQTIDPRTNAPHTLHRIETALEEAKIHIDPFKDVNSQVTEIIKELRPILPMKVERKKVAMKIGASYAHHAYGFLKGLGIEKEEWTKNGDLVVVVEIFSGMKGEIYEKINRLTNGSAETRELG
ncbi:MAG: ribosome assembly factor SBDS [Candidatus Bilamarchaeaceae archaeon]